MNLIPCGVSILPLCTPFSVCLTNPFFSNCCNTTLIILPEPLENAAGLTPLFFLLPYLTLSLFTPIGPRTAHFLNTEAVLKYHQSGLTGNLSLPAPVFTNIAH